MRITSKPLILPVSAPPDPARLFQALGGPAKKYGFLLESALAGGAMGRYSWAGVDPFLVIEAKDNRITLTKGETAETILAEPLSVLEHYLDRYRMPRVDAPVPFWGGAVGYFAYDLGRRLEALPQTALDDQPLPDLLLGFYHTVVGVDHQSGRVYACAVPLPGEPETALRQRAGRLVARLEEPAGAGPRPAEVHRSLNTMSQMGELSLAGIRSHFTRESYCRAVERAKEYIAAGDIFQVNLAQRLSARLQMTPWQLYLVLRRLNPAPFASYLHFPGFQVTGASPERFLHLNGRRVVTRPIKGTRPRGRDEESDRARREELWNSAKDRAELTMIIDLERNDLGRVCETGSVRVPELFRLEAYPTVFHLVSTVEGLLAPGKNVVDLLRGTFPGGSITGAPKIRAMEIIEELEPVRRGIYTGSTGWIGFHGDADLNIVIRTVVAVDGLAHFHVGGGLTAGSVPEDEYEETLDKARAVIRALRQAENNNYFSFNLGR